MIALWVLTFKILLTVTHLDKIPLGLLFLFYSLATFSSVKQFYFDKKLNYRIQIDVKGIKIDAEFYEWTKISNTAILFKGQARGSRKLLILEIGADSYEKFDLTNFDLFDIKRFAFKLSNYIEYFKNK
jgi:hypothetical protein